MTNRWKQSDSKQVGSRAQTYVTAMKIAKISVDCIKQTVDGMVPVVMIGGSVETSEDALIEEEIWDRFSGVGVTKKESPDLGLDCPKNAIIKLIIFLWHQFVQPLWTSRIDLLHRA